MSLTRTNSSNLDNNKNTPQVYCIELLSQISDEWVMTAAHCVDGATSMKVFLGAHNVRADEEVRMPIPS